MFKTSMTSTRRLKLRQLRLTLIIFIPIFVTILFYIYDGMTFPRAEIKIKLAVNLRTFGTSTTETIKLERSTALKQIIPIKPAVLNEKKGKTFETREGSDTISNYLEAIKLGLLNEQKELISYELEGYNFKIIGKSRKSAGIPKLEDYIMEKGGNPVRNVIFATWRSGSTFLGDILNSHPATFYHYEPLLHIGVNQVRSKEDESKSLRVITQLLSCNYTNIDEFNNWQHKSQERNLHNKRLWRFCQKSSQNRKLCEDPTFISDMCKLFPFQSMKTVRMRLKLGKLLLENKGLNVRLLLLVRDPRAIMQSRLHRDWCNRGQDCIQPEKLCTDLEDDFKVAEALREKYPERFLALRYEDISLHPFKAAKKIFTFFRLAFHPDVNYFLRTHTVKHHGGITSTYRDSSKTPFHWTKEIFEEGNSIVLENVQAICSKVLQQWGYALAPNVNELLSFNPLRKLPWPEMIIA